MYCALSRTSLEGSNVFSSEIGDEIGNGCNGEVLAALRPALIHEPNYFQN